MRLLTAPCAIALPPDDEASKEQGQADDRRRKDQSEKLERDRADEAGRRAREGT